MVDAVLDDLEVTAAAPKPKATGPDTLTLIIGGKEWGGWQRAAVNRTMGTIPANFEVQVTEHYPSPSTDIAIKPGDACQVKIGGDLVITGWIDRYTAIVSSRAHTVKITGRSKSSDLVDCAAFVGDKENPTYQILGGTTLAIAQQLAKPYGVTVSSLDGPGKEIPQFNINLGETPWEIIDRITRYSSLVAYDLPDGTLQLAKAGSQKMASGFVQGANVEQAEVTFTMDERFSEYEGFYTSALGLTTESGGHVPRGVIVKDDQVPRFRRRIIISEQVDNTGPILEARVKWEANRRAGHSQAVTVTADSWRDTAGTLWDVNHLAPIRLPALKLPSANWLIGQLSYTRDEMGQHAIVMLMPQSAFEPEPTVFQPLPPLLENVQGNNPTKPDASGNSP
jgi:prophage tail gpP-like protein